MLHRSDIHAVLSTIGVKLDEYELMDMLARVGVKHSVRANDQVIL
jgi:hypothetical protein